MFRAARPAAMRSWVLPQRFQVPSSSSLRLCKLQRRSLHSIRQGKHATGWMKRTSVLLGTGNRALCRRIRLGRGSAHRGFFTRTGQPHDNEGKAVLFFIIGANVVVFLAWQSAPMMAMMMNHFALSWPNIQRGRLHTLVTAMFSHATVMHLAFNMLTLFFFAEPAIFLLGPLNFLNLYIAAGVLSNIGALAYYKVVPRLNIPASRRVDPNGAMIGASGAVNAAVAFTIAANPRSVIYLYMVIPVPAMLFGVLFIGKDLYGAFQGGDNIGSVAGRGCFPMLGARLAGHAAHLAGAALGLAAFFALRGRRRRF